MLTEKQMGYLLTIAEEQNITAAAHKLYLSQPALSRMLLELERELGTPLFVRNHGKLNVTQAGEIYLRGCRRILQINQSVEREISDRNGSQRGKLLLGVSALTGEYLLPRILNGFEREYPHVQLEMLEARACDLPDMVANGKVDFAVVYENDHPDLNYMVLQHDPVRIQVPPAFAAEHPELHPGLNEFPLTPQMLNGQPFITLRKETGMYKVTEEFFHKFGVTPTRVRETDNMHIANILVRLNRGFALVPNIAIREFFYNDEKSAYCTMAGAAMERTVYACSRRNEYRTEAERFLLRLIAKAVAAANRA